ncbi:MAG: dihydrofolate reductase, partial [Muribaculaceae bacterium]|nr:dihydrofolate reductase [Muribaculaceae bacterium]
PEYEAAGAEVFPSVEQAVSACREVPFIIGGEEIYRSALPFCTRLYLTEVGCEAEDADTFFPPLPEKEWDVMEASEIMTSRTELQYRFVTMVRR